MTTPRSPVLQALYVGAEDRAREAAQGRDLGVHEAAALNDAERLLVLLDEDPQLVHAREVDDFTALHYAAFFGGPQAARVLVERGADVNAFARNEQLEVTPLHSAAAARQLETARILLEHGADPNAEQQGGFTPLDSAVENGDEEMQELLRAHGARVL
jgi:ankyrin repeat protein